MSDDKKNDDHTDEALGFWGSFFDALMGALIAIFMLGGSQ